MNREEAPKELVDDVVERLEAAIFRGDLLPGERIREARLAAQLGVSAGIVREALRQLEGRRIVVRSRNLGTSVVKLTAKEVLELFDLRELLEVGAIRLAARNITDAQLEQLRQIQNLFALKEYERPKMFVTWQNIDLHYQIAIASGNSRLIQLLCGEIWILMRSYRNPGILSAGPIPHGESDHQDIFDALSRRDPDECERAMRAHLQHAKAEAEKHLSGETRLKRRRSASKVTGSDNKQL